MLVIRPARSENRCTISAYGRIASNNLLAGTIRRTLRAAFSGSGHHLRKVNPMYEHPHEIITPKLMLQMLTQARENIAIVESALKRLVITK